MNATFISSLSTLNALSSKGYSCWNSSFSAKVAPSVDGFSIHLELGVVEFRQGKGSRTPPPITSSEVELMETR